MLPSYLNSNFTYFNVYVVVIVTLHDYIKSEQMFKHYRDHALADFVNTYRGRTGHHTLSKASKSF